MKKILLAISFVFACVVVTNAQTQKANETKPAAQAGDASVSPSVPAPVAVPQTVNKEDVKDVTKKEDKKACSKQKSCCKKGDDKAKASCGDKSEASAEATPAEAKKSCCKDKAACDKKKEEAKAEPATEEIKKTEEK